MATQNPIEQEGTYPLPEAQQDRFMFKILVDYPSWDEEKQVIFRTTADAEAGVEAVLDRERLLNLQHVVRRIPVSEHVVEYAMRIMRATRVTQQDVPGFVKDYVSWGAGPRACQWSWAARRRQPCMGAITWRRMTSSPWPSLCSATGW